VNRTRPQRWLVAATYALVTVVTAATLYPVALVLKKAFEPGRDFALSPSPIPRAFTADNVLQLISARSGSGDLLFVRQALNSALVALITTAIAVTLACSAAYALSRYRFPGRQSGLASFLIVQMFPAVLLLMPLYVVLDRLRLLNSLAGLILVYSTTAVPFCVWSLKAYFDSLPRALEDAARIDGASHRDIFFRIVLPLARPGIAVTALFSFMTAWNEFILASTFMTDELSYTLPVLLKSYIGEYNAHWGLFAAGAVLTSIPVMALFYFLQRYLVGGLTAGSVKA
jgi:arabinogalactan oligomer / maltooligosaccharide transport system permease protein